MGRRLVVRDEVALVRFSVRTVAESEDGRYWRELHRRARVERLREGTLVDRNVSRRGPAPRAPGAGSPGCDESKGPIATVSKWLRKIG